MVLNKLVVVTLINLAWFASPAGAQKKINKEMQAKILAEKFATEFFLKKDAIEAAKLTAVPFFEIEQGLERKPTVIKKSADVEKRIQIVLKNYDELIKRGKLTIEKVYDTSGDLNGLFTNEVFNPKSDRGIIVELTNGVGFSCELLTLVSWRKGEPKVIGYELGFAR